MPSRWKSIYPDKKTENLVICVSGAPIKKGFSVLMTDCIQDLNLLEHSLCMPLYIYDKVNDGYDNELKSIKQTSGPTNLVFIVGTNVLYVCRLCLCI